MDYAGILGRAVSITWRYRTLWFFGILAAVLSGASSSSSNGSRMGYPSGAVHWTAGQIALVALIGILLVVAAAVLLVVSRIALMALVKEIEDGRAVSVRRGFFLGFRPFWRYVGASLAVAIPLVLVWLVMVLVGLSPLLLLLTRQQPLRVFGIVLAVVLTIGVVLMLLAFSAAVAAYQELVLRACVLERLGVSASLSRGWRLLRANPGRVALLWLILIVLGIVAGVLAVPIVLVGMAVVAAAVAAIYALAQSTAAAIVVGVVLGLPAVALLVFAGGLFTVFESSVWTLGYLRLAGLTGQAVATPSSALPADPPQS